MPMKTWSFPESISVHQLCDTHSSGDANTNQPLSATVQEPGAPAPGTRAAHKRGPVWSPVDYTHLTLPTILRG